MKTVLITGCSSGYGRETARHFLSRGCNVVATMRTPRADALPRSERLRVLPLDVTSTASRPLFGGRADRSTCSSTTQQISVCSAPSRSRRCARTREVFETNTFGVMSMTQALLPQFRARRSGMIINVTSSATLAPMPLVAVYTASKTAIEGFTASLAFELADFNVAVKLVEPGYGPSTSFTQNGGARMGRADFRGLCTIRAARLAAFTQPAAVTTESDVAEAVWRAAQDTSGQLRFRAGADAVRVGSVGGTASASAFARITLDAECARCERHLHGR